MSTLITGGLGLIGSRLAKRLHEEEEVIILDNLSNNCVAELEFPCEVYPYDVQDVRIVDLPKIDKIYHLASPIGVASCSNTCVGHEIINSTQKIIDIAKKHTARVLFTSTSEIYDTNKTMGPRKEYSAAKELSELIFLNSKIDVNIVRIFSCVGKYQNPDIGFVVPRFVEQARNNEDITVFGGTQARHFSHVDDIVEGLVAIMNSDRTGETLDIGNPENCTTIMNLAEMIKIGCNSKSNIVQKDPKEIFYNYQEYERTRVPNIDKLKRLGWKPKWGLEDIIKDVCDV